MSDMPDIRKITKLFNTKATSINEADNTVVFRISDGKPDRQGEIVDQKSWDFTDYMQNPLLITSHDSSDIENGVGTAQELWYDAQDDSTYGRFKIDPTVSNKAQVAWNLVKAGILRTVSVGFISNDKEYAEDGTPILKNNQLLETSLVLIPANPRAIALAFKDRSISQKDATYLMNTMRSEADEIEKQLNTTTEEETSMSKESEQALLGAIEALTKGMATLTEKVDAQSSVEKGVVADIAAIEDKWDLDEDKWDNFSPIATLYYALQEAYFYSGTSVDSFGSLVAEFIALVSKVADGSYDDKSLTDNEQLSKGIESTGDRDIKQLVAKSMGIETVTKAADETETDEATQDADEANEDAEESADESTDVETTDDAQAETEDSENADEVEKEGEESNNSDAAKDGENDQSGADADEFDEDAELTPEIEAQIDEALAATSA